MPLVPPVTRAVMPPRDHLEALLDGGRVALDALSPRHKQLATEVFVPEGVEQCNVGCGHRRWRGWVFSGGDAAWHGCRTSRLVVYIFPVL